MVFCLGFFWGGGFRGFFVFPSQVSSSAGEGVMKESKVDPGPGFTMLLPRDTAEAP